MTGIVITIPVFAFGQLINSFSLYIYTFWLTNNRDQHFHEGNN